MSNRTKVVLLVFAVAIALIGALTWDVSSKKATGIICIVIGIATATIVIVDDGSNGNKDDRR